MYPNTHFRSAVLFMQQRKTKLYKYPKKALLTDVENADYMLFYRAQGIISIIQKWVQDDFKQPAGTVIKVMTALDGSTEERFETWIKDHK